MLCFWLLGTLLHVFQVKNVFSECLNDIVRFDAAFVAILPLLQVFRVWNVFFECLTYVVVWWCVFWLFWPLLRTFWVWIVFWMLKWYHDIGRCCVCFGLETYSLNVYTRWCGLMLYLCMFWSLLRAFWVWNVFVWMSKRYYVWCSIYIDHFHLGHVLTSGPFIPTTLSNSISNHPSHTTHLPNL